MLKKIKYRIHVLRKLAPMAVGVKKLFVINFFAAVAGLILALLLPAFYSLFIEKVILGRKLSFLLPVIAGYLVIQLINTGIAFLRNRCQYRINNQVTVGMKEKILNNLLCRPFPEYEKINAGEQKMIIDDAVVKICDFTNTQTVEFLINLCQTALLLALLIVLEWHLALVLVAVMPVTFYLNHAIGKAAKKNNEENWENDQAMGACIYNSLLGWREIRALNLEETCEKTFISYAERYSELFLEWIKFWVTRVLIIPKIKDEFLMQFLLYFLGGLLIFNGNITIGALLVFAQYYTQLVKTVQNIVQADTDLQINTTYYDKAFLALEEPVVEETDKETEITSCHISLQNVSFSYTPDGPEIIRSLSLEIKQGERVGIIGESGLGKTTLLKLITGMQSPTSGTILVGGTPLSGLSLPSLYKKIGFVMQENILFNTTIHENLLYGNEQATREDMAKACKKANIDSFIQGLPDGYETVIGEKGIKLSGGQKQRLVLARLFLRDVDMFIFDEATSALDQNSESIVQQAVSRIGRDKTILVVAHRASSLHVCDRIIDLSQQQGQAIS